MTTGIFRFRDRFFLYVLPMVAVLAIAVISGDPGNPPAFAAPIDQCNSTGAVGEGATTTTCTVTITNNFTYSTADPSTPVGSATIVTDEASTTSPTPVTSVAQCNGSGLGDASTVTCTVSVTNNLTGYPLGVAITAGILQCQNSGTADPECTATPPGDDQAGSGGPGGQSVNQCNDSGGSGGTMTCTATAPPSRSTGLPTTINQCNGSGFTGASTVTCTATIVNNFLGTSAPPPTTIPVTTIPVTTIPVTTIPVTTIPVTTIPVTTIPVTTIPVTTIPVTTIPVTTIPVTTIPVTTIPVTTIPVTTIPVTTPPTTTPITTIPINTPVTTPPTTTPITTTTPPTTTTPTTVAPTGGGVATTGIGKGASRGGGGGATIATPKGSPGTGGAPPIGGYSWPMILGPILMLLGATGVLAAWWRKRKPA